ncbi:cytotoxic and regulatory T-cell molecule [Nematolebias whitei]|uniref:cytotoxic and regulatory T-cell molecule n=1 Tax=Nematolebias whitei TaxID=451745 RepID=UPI00189B187F|nr:cytotoxic and regulatory T-cell molecule [Nematolebias whitei]
MTQFDSSVRTSRKHLGGSDYKDISLGAWQAVTVVKGQTVTFRCTMTNAHRTHVEWKNPDGHIMFFNERKVLWDKRYSIVKLSQSEFSISISNVSFKDGGNYTCCQYKQKPVEKTVELTVLDHPRLSVTKHEGKHVIKCSAQGNHHPPQISWEFDHQPEFTAHGLNVHHEDKKYVSTDFLHVYPVKNRVTVKCLVRHPALHNKTLMTFVQIGREKRNIRTTRPRLSTVQPEESTAGLGLTSSWSSPATGPSFTVRQTFSSTGLVPATASSPNTTDGTSVSEPAPNITVYNTARTNTTESRGADLQTGTRRTSHVLLLLVTSLILGLLVVVLFFTVKLRRAHVAWKRENEESDPSEESSKSKSSQEDKKPQGQWRKGLFSTTFTQYVVEEPAPSAVSTNTETPREDVAKEQTSSSQSHTPAAARCDVKETSL